MVEWPPYSPDLNPIEEVWNIMKNWIQGHYGNQDKLSYDTLRKAVGEAWDAVTSDQLDGLINKCLIVARPLLIQMENQLDFRIDILAISDVRSGIAKSHVLTIDNPARCYVASICKLIFCHIVWLPTLSVRVRLLSLSPIIIRAEFGPVLPSRIGATPHAMCPPLRAAPLLLLAKKPCRQLLSCSAR